jgi:hypothetical protein
MDHSRWSCLCSASLSAFSAFFALAFAALMAFSAETLAAVALSQAY